MTEPRLILGDCVEAMRELPDASIDAVVTDPPYGIRFMGKSWDGADIEREVERRAALEAEYAADGREFGARDAAPGGSLASPAQAAGIYDLSSTGNRAFQAWTEAWAREAYRVLKPGGHLLAFAGSRTYHRMACGVEDAGFEVRDCLVWMYGSGFPKSLDVAKAVDKAHGVEGEIRARTDGRYAYGFSEAAKKALGGVVASENASGFTGEVGGDYLPGSEDGRRWKGWGTALKPAFEPIVLARKPLGGTVAANLLEHGVGAINVDGCRIETLEPRDVIEKFAGTQDTDGTSVFGAGLSLGGRLVGTTTLGRWPANVLLGHHPDCVELGTREVRGTGHTPASRPPSTFAANAQPDEAERSWRREVVTEYECHPDCPIRRLDEQAGVSRSTGGAGAASGRIDNDAIYGSFSGRNAGASAGGFGDTGGPSRFFYTAKAGRAERNAGLDAFDERPLHWSSGDANPGSFQSEDTKREARNPHPTVKPVDLMRWLVRLVAPPGSLVLDPFLGSGTTGIACALEGVGLVGVERDPDYLAVAEARIRFWAEHGEDALRIVAERDAGEAARKAREDAGQLDLFA